MSGEGCDRGEEAEMGRGTRREVLERVDLHSDPDRGMPLLYTEIVDCEDAFIKLKEEWGNLLSKSAQNHLYLTHAYLSTWWKHLSRSAVLCIILVRGAGELLAIAPLMLRRATLLRCPVRRVEFAGSGWGYGGFILYKRKRECLQKIFKHLEEMKTWDVMYLGPTLEDPDIVPQDLAELLPQIHSVHDSVRVGIPYIPLRMTWERYLAERSSSFRRNVKSRSKKLNTLGRVEYLRITRLGESGTSLSTVMEWMRAVAEHSWKAKARTAISSDPRVFAFYGELAERLDEMGSLDLSLLFVDAKPVAYIFGALYRGDFLEIDIAFDNAFSQVSPGVLLRNGLLQELLQKQSGKYDFVSYFDYKKELTSHAQDFHAHVFYRRRPYPLVLRWLRRRIRNRMGRLLADYSDPEWGARRYADAEV